MLASEDAKVASVEALVDLLVRRGAGQYGYEPVTQLAHALQAAFLAEQAGEADAVVAAALLHDIGHLVDGADVTELERGRDDCHELKALPLLSQWFGEEVLAPIRLHVEAKRYLCATEPGYHEGLSEASRASLAVQGGVFDAASAAAFIAQPHAEAAVRLRRYDDAAKDPRCATPPPMHYLAVLQRARLPS